MNESTVTGSAAGAWRQFRGTPVRVKVYLLLTLGAACALPFLAEAGPGARRAAWFTAATLVAISVLNIEVGRRVYGGLAHTQQPHKALSAWAFACGILLPAPWLLVVVPFTYAHTWWRGLRVPLWKWVGSAGFLVLSAMAAGWASTRVVGDQTNWMLGDGSRGMTGLVVAALAFLLAESVLFAGVALLNDPEDELWLRQTLRDPSFYLTELGVLAVACLLAGVWTGGPWFVLLLLPLYVLVQRAALLQPMRARAESAAQLAEQNQQLELANRFKVDLVGMLGHEVGNPLTSILGYGQVGREAIEDGDVVLARRCFEVVERNAVQIERVCGDILALARSDGGALSARPQPCDLRPQLLAAAAAQPPGRQPVVECPENLVVQVQPDHLDQIVANLLSNAEKYGGGATRLVASTVGEDRVTVSVVDEGPGVPSEFRGRLFERFSRAAEATRQAAGTGLGLYITRELARANDAEVDHRAGVPTGAVFTLTLPRGLTAGHEDPEIHEEPGGRGRRWSDRRESGDGLGPSGGPSRRSESAMGLWC